MTVSRPRNSLLGKVYVSCLDGDERITWVMEQFRFWGDTTSMKDETWKIGDLIESRTYMKGYKEKIGKSKKGRS